MSEKTIHREADPQDYWQLLKPKVMRLVVFTAIAGMWIAPGQMHPFLAFVAVLCIAINAGAAGAINMWYDRDIDAVMKRTIDRPLPKGLVEPDNALAFGVFLTLFSFMIMGLATNWFAAFLLLAANLFYVFIYTMWLKRRTPQNIVIGGAAGAFPPIIGWAAVTGDVSLVPIALFLLIFLWTPPHFWALAIFAKIDYGKANVPMLPNVAGKAATKRQMLIYTILLIPVVIIPWWLGAAGWFYLVASLAMTLGFLACAVFVMRTTEDSALEDKRAKAMFFFSIAYLYILFAALMVDRADGLKFVL